MTRDPRNRRKRYDGAVGKRQFAEWIIFAVRALAIPTAALSLLLVVDAALPGTAEQGLVYRRDLDARWIGPDRVDISVGWPNRSGCLEERGESGRRFLFTTRPGCAGTVSVSVPFGRELGGKDTLQVIRTPLFGQVRAVQKPTSGHTDDWSLLFDIGLFVVIGWIPLLSFGRDFAVYDASDDVPRYHFAYILPALAAEAFYVWLLLQSVAGG